jgi:hypothetical protein
MVVGEPTLMGGEFGDKDERLIARLENAQYDPTEQPDESAPVVEPAALGRSVPTSSGHFSIPPSGSGPSQARNALRPPFPPGSPVAQQTMMPSWGLDKVTASQPILNNVAGGSEDKLPAEME